MDITRTNRQIANEVDASILLIGSDNIGRVTDPLGSMGDPIPKDQQYDVHIVRHPASE